MSQGAFHPTTAEWFARPEGMSPRAGAVRILYVSPVKALANDVERNLREPLAGICALAGDRGDAFRVPRVAVRSGDTPQSLARPSALAILAWMRRSVLRIIGHEIGHEKENTDEPLNRSVLAGALRDAGLFPSGPGFRL